jgi:guanosine-3',5'-bis(diphosphate) 3'-pyrophosphohydrolase
MSAPTNQLLAAIKFASQKHVAQKRKDSRNTPYINHPIEVAELLSRVGGVDDVEILIAAVLHDTVEDTETTIEEISEIFGGAVASYVMECTDDKTLAKAERKQRQIETASKKSPQAKLIKLADKISNVKDLGESPPAGWSVERQLDYLEWTRQVVHNLRGVNDALDQLYDSTLETAHSQVNRRSNGGAECIGTP